MQVDIVYLWVDSTDKKWQKKRYESFEKSNKNDIARYANADGRFRDNGELLFNLRCLEKFFPDHGQVYIVTDEQRPSWLADNKRVTVIDHKTLFLKKLTPFLPQLTLNLISITSLICLKIFFI